MYAARQSIRWPRQRVWWGDAHLPPLVQRALHLGLLRREFFTLVSRGVQSVNPGAVYTARFPVSDVAHFEWIATTSDTLTAARFQVMVSLEAPTVTQNPEPTWLTNDLVAWESIAGTGAAPYNHPPIFVPAGTAIAIDASVVDVTGGIFNAYLLGCRLVR